MARIEGVQIPTKKRIEYGLTYIFGIGLTTARKILDEAKVDYNKRGSDLSDEEIVKLGKLVSRYPTEGELRKQIALHIKRHQEIGSYRGTRHKRGLPVHGQRTRTNARTRKGPRKAAIALKKKITKK